MVNLKTDNDKPTVPTSCNNTGTSDSAGSATTTPSLPISNLTLADSSNLPSRPGDLEGENGTIESRPQINHNGNIPYPDQPTIDISDRKLSRDFDSNLKSSEKAMEVEPPVSVSFNEEEVSLDSGVNRPLDQSPSACTSETLNDQVSSGDENESYAFSTAHSSIINPPAIPSVLANRKDAKNGLSSNSSSHPPISAPSKPHGSSEKPIHSKTQNEDEQGGATHRQSHTALNMLANVAPLPDQNSLRFQASSHPNGSMHHPDRTHHRVREISGTTTFSGSSESNTSSRERSTSFQTTAFTEPNLPDGGLPPFIESPTQIDSPNDDASKSFPASTSALNQNSEISPLGPPLRPRSSLRRKSSQSPPDITKQFDDTSSTTSRQSQSSSSGNRIARRTTTGSVSGSSTSNSTLSSSTKPYTCEICSQSFTRFQNLKSHYMTHTGVRPYTCTECGLAFSRQHDLKRHERLHTGVKPYKCDICGRSFARLDALNRHLRSDNGTCSGNTRAYRARLAASGAKEAASPASSPTDCHPNNQAEINGNGSSSSGSNGSVSNGTASGYQASGSNGSGSNGNGNTSSSSNGKGNGNGDHAHTHDPYRMIPNPNSLASVESGGSSSNGSNQSESNGEFPGLGLAGRQLHQASSSNENSGESSNGNGNGNYASQVGAAHLEKIANPKREEERHGAVNPMDDWRHSDGEWDPDCDPERFAEAKIAADEYYADDGFSMTDDRSMKGRIVGQFGYLEQPQVRYPPSRHHRHSSRTPRQHYHSHSHSHSHSHHHYGYPPQDQRVTEEAVNRLSASASNSSHTEGSNQSEQLYSQNYYQPLPSPSATVQSMAARNRMSSGTPSMRSPVNQNFVDSSRSENPQLNVNELGHQGYPGRRPSHANPNANPAEEDITNVYPSNPGYRNRSDSHSTVEFNIQSSNSGSSSNNRQPHISEFPSQTSSLSSQQFRLNSRLQPGYDSNNNIDPGSSSSQRRGRRNQSSSSASGSNVNSNTGDFKIPMMVTGVLAYTPRERFLLERNDFLEGKVRELEQHMVEIRTALERQRWLDQRVGDLEVEKRILKQLLFEQSNRNVAEDQSSLSGSAGGMSPSESSIMLSPVTVPQSDQQQQTNQNHLDNRPRSTSSAHSVQHQLQSAQAQNQLTQPNQIRRPSSSSFDSDRMISVSQGPDHNGALNINMTMPMQMNVVSRQSGDGSGNERENGNGQTNASTQASFAVPPPVRTQRKRSNQNLSHNHNQNNVRNQETSHVPSYPYGPVHSNPPPHPHVYAHRQNTLHHSSGSSSGSGTGSTGDSGIDMRGSRSGTGSGSDGRVNTIIEMKPRVDKSEEVGLEETDDHVMKKRKLER